MSGKKLFTDGSVNSKTHVGYGAYLFVDELVHTLDVQKGNIKTHRFENTSSTKLELQILLLALNDLQILHGINNVIIYTDSQNILGLLHRRERLEETNFHTSNNKLLRNYELYQQFYAAYDRFNFSVVKLIGHQQSIRKDECDQLFTLVDRASRAALRKAEKL